MRWSFSAGSTLGVFLATFSAQAATQWIDYPTPGIPRTANEQPNHDTPAPGRRRTSAEPPHEQAHQR